MSLSTMSNHLNQKSSLCPTNGRQTVGDGASLTFDADPSVLAVCHLEGKDNMYYYSTTFSGGPGVRSSDCVTGSPASNFSPNDSPPSSPESSYRSTSLIYPHSPITTIGYSHFSRASPRDIPRRTRSDASTPPLTPDDGSEYEPISGSSSNQGTKPDALDFLMTVFPRQGLKALPYAKSVAITAPAIGAAFDGVVIELPGATKTLYVDSKSAQSVNLRESIVALLDLADESLGCGALVIVLERSSPNLGQLLHSLMYVGGAVITKPAFEVDPAFVLVGLEI
ncbi:ornithine decarboxylase antizyme-domain-containing protein [Infundibulicybe gibba]|nr:ornithine decarboxylase antizyme-domain-containing protein [Infundibulicybe gibba]